MADNSNVVGKVFKDFEFDGELALTNKLGDWHKDTTDNFYWGGGITEFPAKKSTTVFAPSRPEESETVRIDNVLLHSQQIDKIWGDGETGQLATVAILDSGIALNSSDLTDAIGAGVPGGFANAANRMKNFVTGSDTMDDDKGHGSHCAGLIASRNLKHPVGIAKGCKLYVGKITDATHTPSVDNMIKGIRWAAGLDNDSPQDIDIISMSSGSLLNIPDMKPTIDEAISKGKILVFSIGNRDPDSIPGGGTFPALFDNVFSVGAVDFNNDFEKYSYQSENLSIACPGTDIISYWIGGEIRIETGTSQSAAICAGIIALLVSKLKRRGESNIQKKIKDAIMNSSTKNIMGFTYRCIEAFKLYETI